MTSRIRPTPEQGDFIRQATPHFYDRIFATAAALEREQIAQPSQLPGQPGRNKTRESMDAAGCSRRGLRGLWNQPGAVTIFRRGQDWFEVHITVGELEQLRRREYPDHPLRDLYVQQRRARALQLGRAHLRLVSSR
jgi:hypothetical protein